MTKKEFNYSKSITEIEQILSAIEKGEQDIDKLSTMVNRATELIKLCRNELRTTEEKINKSIDDVEI